MHKAPSTPRCAYLKIERAYSLCRPLGATRGSGPARLVRPSLKEVMRALSADFETHGETAIETVRTTAVPRMAPAGSRPPAWGGCWWGGGVIRAAREGPPRA